MSTETVGQRSRRGLIGLLTAEAVSLSGTRLSMIALPWFVITTTGSVVHSGLAAFAQMLPYVVAKALAGPLIDRLGQRRVTIVAELASAAAVGLVPLLYAIGALEFVALLGVVALVGVVSGPADGAKKALIPDVAERAAVPLERVTGLSGSIERMATTVGVAGAGAIVAVVGPITALAITSATFVTSAAIIAVTAPGQPAMRHDDEVLGYLKRLGEGLGFIRHDRLLRSLYAMMAITNLLDAASFSVLLPFWAHSTGRGPDDIGLVAGAMGGAAVLTSLLSAAIGHRMPRRLVYLVGFMIAGAPRFVVLALDAPLGVVVAVHVAAGLGGGFLNPIIGAVVFERVPRELVGRVTSMGSSLTWAGIPFGGLVGGGLAAAVGLTPALLILAGAYFVATTVPGLQKDWKDLNRARPPSYEPRELQDVS